MDYKTRINKAIDYAIESDYEIYNRAVNIQKDLYSHKNVCFFGTGKFFRDVVEHFSLNKFDYVADNNPECWGKSFLGRKCLSPKQLSEMEDVVVLITIAAWKEVYKQLQDLKITCYPVEWLVMNNYDEHYSKEWFEKRRSIIINTLDLFEDDISRNVYTEVIINKIAPQYANVSFDELRISGEYFDSDVFKMSEDEYLVDAGAYNGDSIKDFIEVTNGKFGRVYAYEMDSSVFNELSKFVEQYDKDKFKLFNAGVSDEFSKIEYSYNSNGEKKIENLVTIDGTINDDKVTLIKMDIETFELKALEGAKNIIKKQKPKLSISAYHYLSDLWEIPLKIKEFDSNYKIYLRHHSPTSCDTDCYAYMEG